jgi:hypothetical protein
VAIAALATLALSAVGLSTRICPHANLLSSALLTLLATFLCASALAVHADAACHPLTDAPTSATIDVAVRATLAALALAAAAAAALPPSDDDTRKGPQLVGAGEPTSDGGTVGSALSEPGPATGPRTFLNLPRVAHALLTSDWLPPPTMHC